MSEYALKISNLVIGYQKPLIKIAELDVAKNDIICIVGKSGLGKSTIFKTISGLIEPLAGKIFVDGTEHSGLWRRQNVRLILQDFPLLHWLTVGDSLKLAAKIMNIELEKGKLLSILESFSAAHLINKYPRNLSGGERCRASLAHAAISSPRLVLLDEPFSGLDIVTKDSVAEALVSFTEKNNVPLIYITHDLYDACAYANKVIVLGNSNATAIKEVIEVTNEASAINEVRNSMKKYA